MLATPPPSLQHLDYLDGWRGIAIISVLIHHFMPISFINLGTFGVDVFFVLSGLLISRILFIKDVNILNFIQRRFNRTFPLFFVFVSAVYGASWIFSLSSEHENYFYTLTFLRNYAPDTPDFWNSGIPVGHLWSLCVEEHSYLFLALLTLVPIFKHREYLVILGVGGLCIVFRFLHETVLSPPGSYYYEFQTHTAASHILFSAGYYLLRTKYGIKVPPYLPLISFVLALLCFTSVAPGGSSWAFSPILLAFAVNHLGETYEAVKKALSTKALCQIGIISYSIYLWQQPFYYYGVKFDIAFPFAGPILLIVAVAVGYVSFKVIENPSRSYLNGRLQKRKERAVAAVTP